MDFIFRDRGGHKAVYQASKAPAKNIGAKAQRSLANARRAELVFVLLEMKYRIRYRGRSLLVVEDT